MINSKHKENICSICIEIIESENEANLESCIHKFCLDCITNWSKNFKNICPYCKTKFNKILYKNKDGE